MSNFLVLGPGCSANFWIPPDFKKPTATGIAVSPSVFKVGIPSEISLIIANTGQFQTALVNNAQAVVCALNTSHDFNPNLILPSLKTLNPLNLINSAKDKSGAGQIAPGGRSNPPGDPSGGPFIIVGRFTPTDADLAFLASVPGAAFEGTNRDLHCCVLANCVGSAPPSDDTTLITEGAIVDWATALGLGSMGFCSDTHHAQFNTTLARTLNNNSLTVKFFAGVGPQKREDGPTKVFLREQVFEPQADQGLVEMIRRAGLDGLPIQPALVPARVAGIARFKAEGIVEEAREALEHLRGHWADEDDESDSGTPRNVLRLQLAPGEVQPLLVKVAFDRDDPLGAVHVFDVIQLNEDGTRGGFRLATIHTPAE